MLIFTLSTQHVRVDDMKTRNTQEALIIISVFGKITFRQFAFFVSKFIFWVAYVHIYDLFHECVTILKSAVSNLGSLVNTNSETKWKGAIVLLQDTSPTLACRKWGKTTKNLITVVFILAYIRTENLEDLQPATASSVIIGCGIYI